MKEISISNLKQLNNINLIDIRDNYSYLNGTINNSINIPMGLLMNNPSKYLNKEKQYYLFCDSGSNSRILCIMLLNMGYNVVNIKGGYKSYIEDSI